ncbi:hypothetical protein HDU83_005306 [Entophlyctis luteolus]|nr:hypothetical protein HDU82_003808 [Entophlyctis luteolus]KAJ3344177.1 hypothetical protein HDU83_005306 [Entophlyctis luteolus]
MGRRRRQQFLDEASASDSDSASEADPSDTFKRRSRVVDNVLGIFGDEDDDDGPTRLREVPVAFVSSSSAKPSEKQSDDDTEMDGASAGGSESQDVRNEPAEDAMDVDSISESDDGETKKGKLRRARSESEDDSDSAPAARGLGSFPNATAPLPPQPGIPERNNRKLPHSFTLDAREKKAQSARLNPKPDKEFMKFDKDGKGLSFLKKMGYKPGEGLGKEGKGIVNPIDVKVRPQKMGLGHRGFDERTETVKTEQALKRAAETGRSDAQSSDEDSKKPTKTELRADQWKKGSKRKPSKKTVYKTASEIVAEFQNQNSTNFKTRIIDMTQAQPRELENMSQAQSASQIAALRESASHLVELRYNVNTMVSEAQMDLMRLSTAYLREKKSAESNSTDAVGMKTRAELLAIKQSRLEKLVAIGKEILDKGKQLEKLTVTSGLISDFETIDSSFSEVFELIRDEYFDELQEYSLDGLIVGTISPLIKRLYANWSPLSLPNYGVDYFRKWRNLIYSPATHSSHQTPLKRGLKIFRPMTPFESLLYNLWLPRVRQDVNNNWNPLDPDLCIQFIEAWYPSSPAPATLLVNGLLELSPTSPHILPPWLHRFFLNSLIVPKLTTAINDWNPKLQPPPHTWLFSWLPHISRAQFTAHIVHPVKHRLSRILAVYSPTSLPETQRLIALVEPWVTNGILSSQLSSQIATAVLPSLIAATRSVAIDPANQKTDVLVQVFSWKTIVPQHLLSHVLETEFFPRWLRVLWAWLRTGGEASEGEVAQWYTAWRDLFDANGVGDLEGVHEGFRVGLALLARVVNGEGVGGAPPQLVPLAERADAVRQPVGRRTEPVVAGLPELRARKELQVGFQELLERTAAASGLALVPAGPGRSHPSGKPVFRMVGETDAGSRGVVLVVDDGVVFVYTGGAVGDAQGEWVPKSIDDVVSMARSGRK